MLGAVAHHRLWPDGPLDRLLDLALQRLEPPGNVDGHVEIAVVEAAGGDRGGIVGTRSAQAREPAGELAQPGEWARLQAGDFYVLRASHTGAVVSATTSGPSSGNHFVSFALTCKSSQVDSHPFSATRTFTTAGSPMASVMA